jgi:hypothetical protein
MTDTSTMDTALVIGAGGGVGIQLAAVHGSQAVFVAAGIGFNAPVATLEACGLNTK